MLLLQIMLGKRQFGGLKGAFGGKREGKPTQLEERKEAWEGGTVERKYGRQSQEEGRKKERPLMGRRFCSR